MAQTNYTPISLYYSTTASATPSAGNLVNGELAINITDGKLYYKDAGGTVQVLATSAGAFGTVTSVNASGGTTGLSFSGGPVTSSGTLTLSGTLIVDNGGTGATSFTQYGLVYGNNTGALQVTTVGANGQVLVGNTGAAPGWSTLSSIAVTDISFGTTGLTPNTASQGSVTVAGTLVAANGGTGQSSYAAGDTLYASGSTTLSKLTIGGSGQYLVSNGTAPTWQSQVLSITFVIDGGGATIETGVKGDLEIPFACTINQWTLLADQSGSIVVDIWKDTYANYPPTVADTITGSAKPTISASNKGQSSTLTGWTTSIAAGDTLRFNVDSATTITRVTLSLKVTRT